MFPNSIRAFEADKRRAASGNPPELPVEKSIEYQQCVSDCNDIMNPSGAIVSATIAAAVGAVVGPAAGLPSGAAAAMGFVTTGMTQVLQQSADAAKCNIECEKEESRREILRFSPQSVDQPPPPRNHPNLGNERGRDQWFDRQMSRGRR